MAMATARSNNFPERLLTIATGKGRLKLQNLGPTEHKCPVSCTGSCHSSQLHCFTSRFGQKRHVFRLARQACIALTGSEDEQHLRILAARASVCVCVCILCCSAGPGGWGKRRWWDPLRMSLYSMLARTYKSIGAEVQL